jgi:hypothetical protein
MDRNPNRSRKPERKKSTVSDTVSEKNEIRPNVKITNPIPIILKYCFFDRLAAIPFNAKRKRGNPIPKRINPASLS